MGRNGSARVLFYPHSARAFTSALVGHLHEVSQHHSVVLLTERLPNEYLALLGHKNLFPGLEQVRTVNGLGFRVGALIRENRRWHRLAGECLDAIRPSVIIGENDMSSLFEMYLMREGKRRGIGRLTIQALGQARDTDTREYVDLLHMHKRSEHPSRVESALRWLRCRARQELGHVLVHYLLPWACGDAPLRGTSSYIKLTGAPGMRDSDLHLVQSLRQFEVLVDSHVPPERLGILKHPLDRISADVFFPNTATRPIARTASVKRILVLMSACAIGFERKSRKVITSDRRLQVRRSILAEIEQRLPGWEIVVKAHPDFGSREAVKAYLGSLPQNSTLIAPGDPAEPLLTSCDAVLDLPAPWTSTLVTAASALSGQPVIAADIDRDFFGDLYKGWPEIEYVDEMDELRALLDRIRQGSYVRPTVVQHQQSGARQFKDTNAAISFLLERQ